MARFEANIAALVSLRQAVLTFRGRMADAIDAADAEIRRVEAAIEAAEQAWRREVERRNAAARNCERAAIAAAAADAGYVDCSPHLRALEAAEQRVAEIGSARDHLFRVVDRY